MNNSGNDFSTDIHHILLSGSSTETYFYKINTSVPKPGTLPLLSLSLAALGLWRTERNFVRQPIRKKKLAMDSGTKITSDVNS
jgi:hypothetical protein